MHCILSYGVSFTIHCVVYDTLRRLRYTPSFTIHSVLHQISRTSVLYSTFLLLILHSFLHPSRRLSFVYLLYILRISCIYPVYILCISCVHPAPIPFYHLRSNLTFGLILPRIIEQVLCPRYSTFLSIFITFIYRCSRDL